MYSQITFITVKVNGLNIIEKNIKSIMMEEFVFIGFGVR
jgi:hypothetical protein